MTGGIHKVAGGRTIRWLAAETPFFQRLEKDFPMAGKPFAPRKVRAVRKKRWLESGMDANIENHENRFADIERWEGCGGAAGTRESCLRDSRNAKASGAVFPRELSGENLVCWMQLPAGTKEEHASAHRQRLPWA